MEAVTIRFIGAGNNYSYVVGINQISGSISLISGYLISLIRSDLISFGEVPLYFERSLNEITLK